MDNELKEKLNEMINEMFGRVTSSIKEKIDEAIKEPCEIHIDKTNEGKACLEVQGKRLPLLITLCGLEKEVLKSLDCDEEEFEMLKKAIGTKEAKDNE